MRSSWYIFFPLALISCSGSTPDNTGALNDQPDSVLIENTPPAVDFNNEITFMQEGILDQVDVLFQSDSTNIDINLDNTIFELDLNLQSLESMQIPAGGDSLQAAMINLMNFYRNELTGGFNEMVMLIKKPVWNDAEDKKVKEYDIYFAAEEKRFFEKVIEEQEKFAAANKIELQEQQ